MLRMRCHRQGFTFQILPMTTKRILTINDIAKELGISSRRLRQLLARGLKIPGKQKHLGGRPSGKYQRVGWYNSAELRQWIQRWNETTENIERTRTRPSRAGRNSQRRQQRIDKLQEMLSNGTGISDRDKKLAIGFAECLFELHLSRCNYSSRLVLISLLQGIEAHVERQTLEFFDLPEKIDQAPTDTTPQDVEYPFRNYAAN